MKAVFHHDYPYTTQPLPVNYDLTHAQPYFRQFPPLDSVVATGTGFILRRKPDTVRAPDVGFVRAGRLTGSLPVAFFPGAPNLAVEVRSPGDTDAEVLAKMEDGRKAGCLAVWVIDPADETATVYRLVYGVVLGRSVEELDGEEIVPGFRLRVADSFAS